MHSTMSPTATAGDVASKPTKAVSKRKNNTHTVRNMLVAVVLAIAATAVVAFGWILPGRGAGAATISEYPVSKRSFNVVLKEKGELKAAKSTDIKSEVEGRCTIISLIPEGTAVKEGDLLVELASDKIDERIQQEELKETNSLTSYESAKTELEIQQDKNRSDIRKAELEIELKQLALDRYKKGDWAQQLRDAEIAIEQATIRLERATEDYNASFELKEKKYITLTQFEEDEFEWKKAQWDLDKAKQALEVLNTYTHIVDMRTHESNLDEAIKEADRVKKSASAEENKKQRNLEGAEKELALTREQLSKLRSQKQKTRIVAPTQGFVVYGDASSGGGGRGWMSSEGQIKEGAEVYERQVLMQLPDTTEMMVVVRIHEAKTDKLQMGQAVNIDVEGFPGRQFTGKVSKIAVVADSQNRWLNPDLKEYETEIRLDPSDAVLKPGVTAYAEIMVGNVEDSLAIPLPSIYSKGGKRYVAIRNGKEVKPVEVKTGAVSTEWAAINEGLNEGDKILLAFSDDFKRMIPDAPGGGRGGAPGMSAPGGGGPTQAGNRGGNSGEGGKRREGGGGQGGPGGQRMGRGGPAAAGGSAPAAAPATATTESKPGPATSPTPPPSTPTTAPTTATSSAAPTTPPAKQGT